MTGSAPVIEAQSTADAYAATLLASVGATSTPRARPSSLHADLEWAASGAMALTGFADGPPLLAPGPLATAAHGSIAALAAVAEELELPGAGAVETIDGPALLGERAAIASLGRRGTTSPGATCHLVRCADGWLAINLARSEDVALLPAWLGETLADTANAGELLEVLSRPLRARAMDPLVERARLLGLPIAAAARTIDAPTAPIHAATRGARARMPRTIPPLVIDLSSLWAGPLGADLLAIAGARVIKIESTRRPDGARRGPRAFHDLLNGRKESVALDLSSLEGVRVLEKLVAGADIVVESARPRALRQLGIDAERVVGESAGLVWVSITGYGRREPDCDRVAFGDDAAAAAGLAMALAGPDGVPVFCADAIADPLAGLHAAVAALTWWQRGESVLLDVALRDVTAYAAAFPAATRVATVCECENAAVDRSFADERAAWEVVVDGGRRRVRSPRARPVTHTAHELGADNASVLAELARRPC